MVDSVQRQTSLPRQGRRPSVPPLGQAQSASELNPSGFERTLECRACPQCYTWRDDAMFAPRKGKKPCMTCTDCRDKWKAR